MKKSLSILFLLFLMACSQEKEAPEPPSNLIELEKFKTVMVDVQLLEASFNQKFFREDDPKVKVPEFYQQVFDKHSIDRPAFDSSYTYYSNQPEVMMDVYEYVITELSQREEKISTINNEIRNTDNSALQSEQ